MKKQSISLRHNLSKIIQELIQKNDLFCSMLTIKVISIKKIILSFLRLPFLVACFNKKIDNFKMYAPSEHHAHANKQNFFNGNTNFWF